MWTKVGVTYFICVVLVYALTPTVADVFFDSEIDMEVYYGIVGIISSLVIAIPVTLVALPFVSIIANKSAHKAAYEGTHLEKKMKAKKTLGLPFTKIDKGVFSEGWTNAVETIEPETIVKGVFEWVIVNYSKMKSDWVFTNSELWTVWIAQANDELIVGMEPQDIWKQHQAATPASEDILIRRRIPLDTITSIEVSNNKEYDGNKWEASFELKRQQFWLLKQRHNFISTNNHRRAFLNYEALHVVFAFDKNGERHKLTQTMDRGEAIKTHAQVRNLFEAYKLKGKATPSAKEGDYL